MTRDDLITLADDGHVFVVGAARDAEAVREAGFRAVVCEGWVVERFIDNHIEIKNYDEAASISAGLIFVSPPEKPVLTDDMCNRLEAEGISVYPRPKDAKTVDVCFSLSVDYFENGVYPFIQSLEIAYEFAEVARTERRIDYKAEAIGSYESRLAFDEHCERRSGGGIQTGISSFDSPVSGFNGLHTGLYVVGAMSSMGKTFLLMQIAENISAQGIGVIMVSLEMSKHVLRARGIVRAAYLNALRQADNGTTVFDEWRALSYYDVYYGRDKLNNERQGHYARALERYEAATKNLWIYEARHDTSVRTIDRLIKKHMARTNNKRLVVMVDYLQLLRALKPNHTEKQKMDEAVSRLHRMGIKYDIPIVAVSALNRQSSYTSITLDSFRESSAIGYSAEVALGLQPRGMLASGCGDDKKAEGREITDKTNDGAVRHCEVVIAKDREGKQSRRIVEKITIDGKAQNRVSVSDVINLDFIPRYFHFEDAGETVNPP